MRATVLQQAVEGSLVLLEASFDPKMLQLLGWQFDQTEAPRLHAATRFEDWDSCKPKNQRVKSSLASFVVIKTQSSQLRPRQSSRDHKLCRLVGNDGSQQGLEYY